MFYFGLIMLTAPYLITWGRKRSFLEKIYVVFVGSPFDYSKLLWLIVVNGFFWFLLFYALYVLINFARNKNA
jgi:hypothetical protein